MSAEEAERRPAAIPSASARVVSHNRPTQESEEGTVQRLGTYRDQVGLLGAAASTLSPDRPDEFVRLAPRGVDPPDPRTGRPSLRAQA